MKPSITFITPPSIFLLDQRVFPSLGILKVAAAAGQLGYSVDHLDLNAVENYEDAVASYICREPLGPFAFAITATTPQMVAVTKITDIIRYLCPESQIILGGPHPTLVLAATKSHSRRAYEAMSKLNAQYDTVVAGDGELVIGPLLEHGHHGTIDADDPKGQWFLTPSQLAELPLPARHLIDLKSYKYEIDGVPATPLISQLGCPFGCNFCAGRDSAMLRRVRLRPTASVIAEMRHLYEVYGYRGFMFFDDETNVNKEFIGLLQAICDLQDDLGVEFRCRGFVKSELFTEAQAAAMYKAGFRMLLCGFESGSDRILKNINKNATKDDNTRVMELSHKYGLDVKALMSVGHPGESPETLMDTMSWLLDVAPKDFDCTIITTYPGSPYYDRAERVVDAVWKFETNGDRLFMRDVDYAKVEDFYKGSLDGYKSYVWTDYLDEEQIVWMRDHIERHVRSTLKIPFNHATPALKFESSMGQLPSSIYRRSL